MHSFVLAFGVSRSSGGHIGHNACCHMNKKMMLGVKCTCFAQLVVNVVIFFITFLMAKGGKYVMVVDSLALGIGTMVMVKTGCLIDGEKHSYLDMLEIIESHACKNVGR